ncbi:DUF2164 domain-containing protein [Candidatus Cloacimonadota bacterium]
MKDRFELTRAEKDLLIEKIVHYFINERSEEIGRLAAELLLDFFTEAIGPEFYNRGVRDSISYMTERIEDMYSLEKVR